MPPRRAYAFFAALFIAGLTLRAQLVGAAPLFPLIGRDLKIPHAVVGLLGTIPVLCMGVFAPLAPIFRGRLGTAAAIWMSLLIIGGFGVARVLAPNAWLVVLLTLGVGAGIGLAGALLPVLVKEYLPHRAVRATGIYSVGMQTGATGSAALAVPIALAAGTWRVSLLVFSLITLVLAIAWIALTRSFADRQPAVMRAVRMSFAFGNPLAWRLAIVFALFGVYYYGLTAWLSASYVERGWSLPAAGSLVAVLNAGSLTGALLVPVISQRIGSRARFAALLGAVLLVAGTGIAAAPALAYFWCAMAGLANGVLFPVLMALPVEVAERSDEVAAISSVMLGVGYSVAALAPSGLGAIRDQTHSFAPVLWLIVVASLVLFLVLLFDALRSHRYY